MLRNLCLGTLLVFLCACNVTPKSESAITLSEVAKQYVTAYQKRENFDEFLSYYDENVVLEDMLYGIRVNNKREFAEFFNWAAGDFKVLNNAPTFVVTQQVIDEQQRTIVLYGSFNPFVYNTNQLGPWRFTTLLKLNEDGLIYYQQDWINYFPRSFINEANNLNIKP
ncbi:hypothetical protein N480_08090 [Pseudoalteromonas luteoviolacea S2607]|uniref:nuclear transport factor 2 family protein n=1 Tax=Pseudoalteromonas luteoviolacea TaxID=43657 RepID=UPI0007B17665|nr:nuclear transport factor 2 family protein [Pseudoalteromonas luteoviolacea]KZN28715.1 hypothetical protein N480_08090 [Pseudoalteromonas luteoviolacea S2607]